MFLQLLPNHDMDPKKLAAVCWTYLLSSLGDLLCVSSTRVEGVRDVLRDLLVTGARGRSWNLEHVWVETVRMLWLSLGTPL